VQGEFEGEGGPLAYGAFNANPSLVGFDHFAGEREAESGASLSGFIAGFSGEEAVEDFLELIGGDPGAGVLDDDFGDGGLGMVFDLNGEPSAGRHRLTGVDDEVHQDLLNLSDIDECLRMAIVGGLQLNAMLLEILFDEDEDIADDLGEIGDVTDVSFLTGIGEETGGDFSGALSGGEDFIERAVAAFRILIPKPKLGVIDDGHQDVVEFVRDREGKLADGPQFLGLHQLLPEFLDLLQKFLFSFARHGRLQTER